MKRSRFTEEQIIAILKNMVCVGPARSTLTAINAGWPIAR